MLTRLRSLLLDWRHRWQENGWQTLPAILKDVLALPYSYTRFIIVARSLTEPLPALQPKISLRIRPFIEDDLKAIPAIMEHPSQIEECRLRFEREHVGYVAIHKDQLVGYSWACDEVVPALEDIPIELEEGDMLCVDSFTAPEFRSKGIQTVLSLRRLQHFKDIGYTRALGYIESSNAPSSASWRKNGSQVLGTVIYQRIGLWRRSWYEPETEEVIVLQNG